MSWRTHLQNGNGRWGVTFAVAAIIPLALWYWWPKNSISQKALVEGMQKVAFVAAAFGVTAYNLRTRLVDLLLKVEGSPDKIVEFCRIARGAGQRLTNLVVLFTVTATVMGTTALFPSDAAAAKFFVLLAAALLAASSIAFLYILFAFELLERMILDEAEETARRKEGMRLFKTLEPPAKAA